MLAASLLTLGSKQKSALLSSPGEPHRSGVSDRSTLWPDRRKARCLDTRCMPHAPARALLSGDEEGRSQPSGYPSFERSRGPTRSAERVRRNGLHGPAWRWGGFDAKLFARVRPPAGRLRWELSSMPTVNEDGARRLGIRSSRGTNRFGEARIWQSRRRFAATLDCLWEVRADHLSGSIALLRFSRWHLRAPQPS